MTKEENVVGGNLCVIHLGEESWWCCLGGWLVFVLIYLFII